MNCLNKLLLSAPFISRALLAEEEFRNFDVSLIRKCEIECCGVIFRAWAWTEWRK